MLEVTSSCDSSGPVPMFMTWSLKMLSLHLCVRPCVPLTQGGGAGQSTTAATRRQSYQQENWSTPTASTHISRLDMARLDVMEMFHGIRFPGHLHTQDSLQLALEFPFQDPDILIASYPKSGERREEIHDKCLRAQSDFSDATQNYDPRIWDFF